MSLLGDVTKSTGEVTTTSGGLFAGLADNPLFSAGAGVAGLGVGFAFLRQGVLRGILLAQRYYTVSLEIPSKDRSYQWVLQWISKHGAQNTQHIGVETTFSQLKSGQIKTSFDFVPSPGRHWIRYKRNFIQVQRDRDGAMIDLNSGMPWETVTLTALGRDRKVFHDLLEDAREIALQKTEGKTVMYTSLGLEWRPFGSPRKKRPLDSVVLDSDLSKEVTADIQDFLSAKSAQWYSDRGIPYRRGYLLHGPPGCGKSSFIQALAGHLDYNICILNLNERGLTDDRLNHMLNQLPPRSFVLLEDVDAAFNQRNNTTAAKEYSVTFSGLLNTLDGVASTEERIVFMTTNHPECLDPALIRPGRVDKKVEISYVTPDQVYAMFTKFYPEDSASDVNMGALATEFVAAVTSTLEEHQMTLSGAELQGLFMYYKDQPHRALEDLPKRLVAEKLAYQEALAAAQAQQLQQQKEFPQM